MKMGKSKWVMTITIDDCDDKKLSDKDLFKSIIKVLRAKNDHLTYVLNKIDATGNIGNKLTECLNEDGKINDR